MSEPIAILCSDLHLSLRQPACRADKDWMEVQAGYLKQLRDLSTKLGELAEPLPVICAGDIFDRWNCSPEIINFALEHLPDEMLCVPGQHDLPEHRQDQEHRSGYGTLRRAGKIIDLGGHTHFAIQKWMLVVKGFPWGTPIGPMPKLGEWREEGYVIVACVHAYCWTVKTGYPGASAESHLGSFMKPLRGYNAAVFGDNHKAFLKHLKTGTWVLNSGCFIRRKSDEIPLHPSVGILNDLGEIKRCALDCSKDRFHGDAVEREAVDLSKFIEGLESLGEHGLNFRDAVETALRSKKINPKTKELVLRALDNKS